MRAHGFAQDGAARAGGQGALPQHQVGKRRSLSLDVLGRWKRAEEQAVRFS